MRAMAAFQAAAGARVEGSGSRGHARYADPLSFAVVGGSSREFV